MSALPLDDQEVVRLVKKSALTAGARVDLSGGERADKSSGRSLRRTGQWRDPFWQSVVEDFQ
jgi:hypothetical protein